MNTKTCLICYESKKETDFTLTYNKKGGKRRRIICKACAKKGLKEVDANKINDKILCHTCYTHKSKINFTQNNSKNSITGYSSYCRECKNKKHKDWKSNNKDKIKSYKRKYYINNKNILYQRQLNRMSKDKVLKLKIRIRSLIAKSFIKNKTNKNNSSLKILGCTMEFFKQHIESQFLNWMHWENYGNCKTNDYKCSWHLDHIIPVSLAKTEKDLILLNHWSNFQPKCSKNNIEKGNELYLCINLENENINNFLREL